ncbi:MAG: response regulator transcription factor [Armatimonadetes bacterium]|nr:response regulator transcription factor [Armatimonadota bacterium]
MSTRILLVDDHAMLRDGLRAVLGRDLDMVVVGEAESGLAALDAARRLQPDVVVMDIGMADMNGLEATRELVRGPHPPKVVILSTYADRHYVLAALEAGASAYVTKSAVSDELVRAVHAVILNQGYLCPQVAGMVIETAAEHGTAAAALAVLGEREREVLQLVAEGRSTRQIAGMLHLSEKTVETHRRNIMQKLDLHSVAELTKFAVRHGLTLG